MGFKYNKLLGRIIEVYGTRQKFADAMGFSDNALRNKLNGDSVFKQDEIFRACELLGIKACEIHLYFFTTGVQKSVL